MRKLRRTTVRLLARLWAGTNFTRCDAQLVDRDDESLSHMVIMADPSANNPGQKAGESCMHAVQQLDLSCTIATSTKLLPAVPPLQDSGLRRQTSQACPRGDLRTCMSYLNCCSEVCLRHPPNRSFRMHLSQRSCADARALRHPCTVSDVLRSNA